MANWWDGYPWRMIQTNLREIDMVDIDASVYADWMNKMGATVAMINAAGIIASYRTELPFHFQSPCLQGGQLVDIIDACHRQGVKVLARTDFSKVRRPLYEEHPEWACVYSGGVIEDYNGDVHCCINGDYQQVCSHEIIKELLSTHDFDGIFFNMGGFITKNYSHRYLGICRCDRCRTAFLAFSGYELPLHEDKDDPIYRKYELFRREVRNEHARKTVANIKKIRPDIAINRNTIDGTGILRQESNTEFDRPLPRWQYSGSANTKWAVTSWPDLVCTNTTVDFIGFYYRHVAVCPVQQELRLWQNLANCGGLDYYLIGRLDNHRDRSGYDAVKRVFGYHAEHFESTYKGLRPNSEILLVRDGSDGDAEYRGWFRMLAEGHFFFDVVTIERLPSVDLDSYGAIALPDTKYLGDESASLLDVYVEKGGTLIATGESGLYDEALEPRWACALQSLGIRRVRGVRRDLRSALLEIDDPSLFPGLANRDLLYFGDTFIFADYVDLSDGFLRYIPPHNYGPPERCYWTQVTEMPGLRVTSHGSGRGIHIPWLPGGLYHREGYDNTLLFIWDVLRMAGLAPVEGNLSPMVEITRSGNMERGFTLIQLVNGAGHFGNSFFDPPTMRDLSFSIPFLRRPADVCCLNGGRVDVVYDEGAKELRIELDRLDFFEAVKIES